MTTTLNDFIIEYPNALSDELCDRLISKFEDNIESTYPGQTGAGLNAFVDEDKREKISTDLFISTMESFSQEDSELCTSLGKYLMEYHGMMSGISRTFAQVDEIIDKGFQIQKTEVGGKYDWHTDEFVGAIFPTIRQTKPTAGGMIQSYAMYERRMYTYIFYLNDQETDFEGGNTEFITGLGKDEIRVVKPEKGKLVMFPANAMCTHRGAPVTSGKKYLATGWAANIIFITGGDTKIVSDKINGRYNSFMDSLNESITSSRKK